jgi:hypothetical protein
MHRSGTSAVTGALGGLGLQMPRPGDRIPWHESNPEHWESLSLSRHDDGLLNSLGGSWDGPPDLSGHWLHTAAVLDGNRTASVLAGAYPESAPPAVKDPRLCLLLPLWRTVLPDPVAALLVWRSPLAVARSLHRRDGLALTSGLALWERYNRSALAGLAGIPTYVTSFESVVADPVASVTAWADWLGSTEPLAGMSEGREIEAAAAAIAPGLRHQSAPRGGEGGPPLSGAQELLHATLTELAGGHRPLEPCALAEETPWATDLLATRREVGRVAGRAERIRQEFYAIRQRLHDTRDDLVRTGSERDAARAERDATRDDLKRAGADLAEHEEKLRQLYESTSWKATKALRAGAAKLEQWGHRPAGPGQER